LPAESAQGPRGFEVCKLTGSERISTGDLFFRDDGVIVLVAGGTAAEQAQNFTAGVPEFMFLAGWNGDGIPCSHFARFIFDADFPGAVRNVINFLGARMKMFLGRAAHRQPRLGETLVADGGVAMREQLADFRAVLGRERFDLIEVFYIHKFFWLKTFGQLENF
jgi:hypothetical protein